MKIILIYKQLDSSFSQEYADEYNFGEEGGENWKEHWSYEIGFDKEFDKIEVESNGTFHCKEETPDGSIKNLSFENTTLVKLIKNSEIVRVFAVSKELLAKTQRVYHKKSDTTRFSLILKDRKDYQEILDGVYILNKYLPA
jgi:hypothetical protein